MVVYIVVLKDRINLCMVPLLRCMVLVALLWKQVNILQRCKTSFMVAAAESLAEARKMYKSPALGFLAEG